MVQEEKPANRKKGKPAEEQLKARIKDLYASRDELPAAISIHQAEELMRRVKELEAKLTGGAPAAAAATAPAAPEPAPAEETPVLPRPARKSTLPAARPAAEPGPARFPRLARLWTVLTGAHADITEPGERQQAQLAAALSIGLGILMFLALILSTAMIGEFGIQGVFISIYLVIIFATYLINRSPYHKWGSGLVVVGLAVAGYGLAVINPSRASSSLFSVIPLSLIISSLLLPLWGLPTFTLASFSLTAFLLPRLIPGYSTGIIDGGYFLTMGVLLIIAVAYRNSVERLRVAEVTTVNRELQAIQTNLELRVQDRTHDLELAAEVGRTITERVADMQEMLTAAAEMIRSRFDLYYTQVYLADLEGKVLILRAGTGEVGQELLRRRHQLPVSAASLNGRAASEKRPVIVADTSANSSFLPNPLLPKTRSEMAIPLIAGGRVIGVLDMQSEVPGSLNEVNLPAFQALAGQLSVAIQNASLFAQTQEARQEVEANVRRTTQAGWQEFLNSIERSEKLGFLFDQQEIRPVNEFSVGGESARISIPITVTGAEIGKIQTAEDSRPLTERDREIIAAAAARLGQHIESLRLLAQAEKYRDEAEQALRRLTREGWETYLTPRMANLPGFVYDRNEVRLLEGQGSTDSETALSQPLVVRDETIGELGVDLETRSEQAAELVSAVASQLSGHIENLRLLEEAERGRQETETSETRLHTLIENASEAILVLDLTTGKFSEPNHNAATLYGLPIDELVKVGPADMSPPTQPDGRDSAEAAMGYINEALQGRTQVFEWIHRNAQGVDFPCEVRLVRIPGELPQLRVTVTDITERKKAEEIIARRALQLETVSRLSTTASTVLNPDDLLQAVVDLTKERFNLYHVHIYLANETWQTLVLASGAGEVGRTMVAEAHSIAMDAERSLVARAARERQAVIVNDVRGDPGFLPNPALPETRSEMAVPMIVGEQVLGVFDVQSEHQDNFSSEDAHIYTTLASQVAVALQNARLYVEQAATVTQLRELDRLKSSFLANMSHELRTPLNSILGFSDVMLEELDGPLTETMTNDLQLIQKNGQHLLHLINDVLDMAKIEAGRMNLAPENFTVHEVLQEVISITSTLAGERSLSLSIDPESETGLQIFADRTRLRQVMINLVNNSIKFTEQGGIAIRASRQADKHILIAVRDTGIGIPSDKLETIFQEFAQIDTSTTRKAGGTGLGLPISRKLVEMHGGRLWAESSGVPGQGSTFYVELPLEACIEEPEKQEK